MTNDSSTPQALVMPEERREKREERREKRDERRGKREERREKREEITKKVAKDTQIYSQQSLMVPRPPRFASSLQCKTPRGLIIT